MLDVEFHPPVPPGEGALALLLTRAHPLTGLAATLDAACNGAIHNAIAADNFTAKKGATCTLLAPGAGLSRIVLVGIGEHQTPLAPLLAIEQAAGAAMAALARAPGTAPTAIAADGLPPTHAAAAALGATLRAYRFDRYRTTQQDEPKARPTTLHILTEDPDAARTAWARQSAIARATTLARDLVNEPPNVLTPAELADRCRPLAELGLTIEILGPTELEAKGFGALLGVAQGSANEPRLVTMQWHGGPPDQKPVCLIGKGVTFDTGGISIKPAAGMGDMKQDMAGAAAVIGAMAALAGRHARANVVGVVGLTENMPSGTAQRPGDIVRSLSGQTIEVLNTDAEGRLVLADVIWYAEDRFDPACTIDLATLTGAIIVSLGHEYAGLFSNDETLATRLLAAGHATGEHLWRMPLAPAYDKLIKSDIADMKNIGGRPAGAIIGAQFIQRFTRRPWAHLDIAGTAWSTKDAPTTPKGATAFGLRLLERLIADHHETPSSEAPENDAQPQPQP